MQTVQVIFANSQAGVWRDAMPTNKEEREKVLATLQSTFSPFMLTT